MALAPIVNFHTLTAFGYDCYVSDITGQQFTNPVVAARHHANMAKPRRDDVVVQAAIPGTHFLVIEGIQKYVNDYDGYQSHSAAETTAHLRAIGR